MASKTGEAWNKLFDKADFFSRYKIFVQIEVFADTEEHHLKWYALAIDGRLESARLCG
jgi:poly(A) polymerase Pap1